MKKRCGFVAVIGRPNTGKSTLINTLTKTNILSVTPKPQTTRHKILLVYTLKNTQIIFLDTPGLLKPEYELQNFMLKSVLSAINDADIILFMIDANRKRMIYPFEEEVIKKLKKEKKLSFLLINKIDIVPKGKILPIIDYFKDLHNFSQIIPISALTFEGLDILMKYLEENLPEGDFLFPKDYSSDKPKEFFICEMIREKIYFLTQKEIPYSCTAEVEELKEKEDKIYIRVIIYIEKPSQKRILVGKKGELIKQIGIASRVAIEEFLKKEVYLDLWVKVKEDWRENKFYLTSLGYEL